MSNVISLQEYKNKKNGQTNSEQTKFSDASPELQARLLRISLLIRNINESMAALKTNVTNGEKK